jgi:hypothetical protein
MKDLNMVPEKPATGILKQGDFGAAKFYYVQCDCSDPACSHTIEVEADEMVSEVQVHIYSTVHTKWWEKNRWKQIWQLLTKGYAEMQTTTVLSEQAALNYADTLVSAMDDVKEFRQNAKNK